MKKVDIYSKDEIKLFEKLEKDVDSGTYKPISEEKLSEKKAFFKQSAINTKEKKKKRSP